MLVWDDSAVLEFTMYTEFTTRVHNVRSVNSLTLLTTYAEWYFSGLEATINSI